MMKKVFLAAAALLVLTGCAARRPEDELSLARERIEKYLFNEESLTQSEMNILSSYMLRLAAMECYLVEYRIWNKPGYRKIEKQFIADCELWNKKLEEEKRKPSEFAGGSREPMDRNVRMTDFLQKRIDELKTEWLAKP